MKSNLSGKGTETMKQRATNFAAASRKLWRLCEATQIETGNSIATLTPFGARRLCGLCVRPHLLNPEAVFQEVATQVCTYYADFGVGADTKRQWAWPPRYLRLPRPVWNSGIHLIPYRGENQTSVRIRRKTSTEEKHSNILVTKQNNVFLEFWSQCHIFRCGRDEIGKRMLQTRFNQVMKGPRGER